MTPIPWVRIAFLAAIVLGLMGAGAAIEHRRMAKKLDAMTALRDAAVTQYNQFKGGVAALGREAAARNATIALADLKRKERADEEHARRTADDRRTIERLRADAARRDSRGGSVSAAPAGSRCPEGQVCFDRAEYQRAIGEFDREARRLADEGTQVTTDLNAAITWSNP